MDSKTNYYLADIEDNYSVMKLVNDRVYDIYHRMAIPVKDLEELADKLKGE